MDVEVDAEEIRTPRRKVRTEITTNDTKSRKKKKARINLVALFNDLRDLRLLCGFKKVFFAPQRLCVSPIEFRLEVKSWPMRTRHLPVCA
jgi:hypothetical protein